MEICGKLSGNFGNIVGKLWGHWGALGEIGEIGGNWWKFENVGGGGNLEGNLGEIGWKFEGIDGTLGGSWGFGGNWGVKSYCYSQGLTHLHSLYKSPKKVVKEVETHCGFQWFQQRESTTHRVVQCFH